MNDIAKAGALELLTADIRTRLLENGRRNAACIAEDGNTIDFHPVSYTHLDVYKRQY